MQHVDFQVDKDKIPISLIGNRYFIFSIDDVTYLRRNYNVSGVLIGTLPQACNQNIFLGLPLQLMPEEAQLLIAKGACYLVDDARRHRRCVRGMSAAERQRVKRELDVEGRRVAKSIQQRKAEERAAALKRNNVVLSSISTTADYQTGKSGVALTEDEEREVEVDIEPYAVTPATSDYLFSPDHARPSPVAESPAVRSLDPAGQSDKVSQFATAAAGLEGRSSRFALFAHLHARGYFLSPGLRFGCTFMAYPGDMLRFHSHFLVRPVEESEKVDVMELVATGRLGTGVKKGLLIGGFVPSRSTSTRSIDNNDDGHDNGEDIATDAHSKDGIGSLAGEAGKEIRCFTLEWSGM